MIALMKRVYTTGWQRLTRLVCQSAEPRQSLVVPEVWQERSCPKLCTQTTATERTDRLGLLLSLSKRRTRFFVERTEDEQALEHMVDYRRDCKICSSIDSTNGYI